MQEDEEEKVPGEADVPANAREAAGESIAAHKNETTIDTKDIVGSGKGPGRLSKLAKGAIFREVVLAKVREEKEREAQKEFEKNLAGSTKKD